MAKLTYLKTKTAGTTLTTAAASAGGDTVDPTEDGFVQVFNGGGSAITVTVVVPGNTKFGQADPDIPVAVAAGATKLIGPFPQDLADPTDGLVHLTYSSVASVTVAAVRV